ncbi:RNA-binding region-containing protein 3-like [Oratosquilla oratoria]|uniref:RNA-binding region-containing protein 3-like n=1 Tax=Oratosquilla oratoria TaxID=337810 RepID=UPI003F764D0A
MLSTLEVWRFPKELSRDDREDMLKHFGANKVVHTKKRNQDSAIASFENESACRYALEHLHQLEVLGKRLVAVYHDYILSPPIKEPHKNRENWEDNEKKLSTEEKQKKIEEYLLHITSTCPELGIKQPMPPHLKYVYPPPSPTILANIAHALVAVPRFYTQTLHLMNKMNLPCPFGPLLPVPPICREAMKLTSTLKVEQEDAPGNGPRTVIIEEDTDIPEEEMSVYETESELESDEEEKAKKKDRVKPPLKRIRKPKVQDSKRRKLSMLKNIGVLQNVKATGESLPLSSVFERPDKSEKKIELRIENTTLPTKNHNTTVLTEEGFGKMKPVKLVSENIVDGRTDVENEKQADSLDMFGRIVASEVMRCKTDARNEMEEERGTLESFISEEELEANRIKQSDWAILPVFKNYTSGEPSAKLYIKNLAKTVEEEDLRHIYGRYIFWFSDEEVKQFTIQVMKEGRMKGQAFITFPSERQAKQALKDTNGYILKDRPMVVMYGKIKTL